MGTDVVKTKETEEVTDKDATGVANVTVNANINDSTIFEDAINGPKQIDHKGQGDGPPATTNAASSSP